MTDPDELGAIEEEREFESLYGRWDPLTPEEVRDLMDGYTGSWWIAGGYAIEAFTGVSRPHHDVDMVIWRSDLYELRRHLGGRFHLWSVGGGMLRPLNEEFPELHEKSSQVWVRTNASEDWLLDVLMNDRKEGLWVFKRRPEWAYPLDEVTWVDVSGVTYLRPEYVLAMKARHARPQDEVDLQITLPELSAEARTWLRQGIAVMHPDHDWLNVI